MPRLDQCLCASQRHVNTGTTQTLPTPPSSRYTRPCAFSDKISLELGNCTHDAEEQPAMGAGGVHAGVLEGDEIDTEAPEGLDEADEVAQGSAQSVQLPDQDSVESSPVSVRQQAIEFRALGLGTADAFVQVLLDNREASGFGVLPQAIKLEVHCLFYRGAPCVDCCLHENSMTNSSEYDEFNSRAYPRLMAKSARKAGHGGRREGAGRPAALKDAVMLSLRVERDLLDALGKLAEDEGVSAYVRGLLQRHVRSKRRR